MGYKTKPEPTQEQMDMLEYGREQTQKALQIIRENMEKREISQLALSEASGYDHSTLSKMLRGVRPRPTFETMSRLFYAMGFEINIVKIDK